MNQTKWSEVLLQLKSLSVQVRLKWLFDSSPGSWSGNYLLPVDGYFEETSLGPIPFREIEWLELRANNLKALKETLITLNIPFSREGNHLKIWGYSSSGVDFV